MIKENFQQKPFFVKQIQASMAETNEID